MNAIYSLDKNKTLTALIAVWFAVIGAILLWGGALFLGAVGCWACGVMSAIWLRGDN